MFKINLNQAEELSDKNDSLTWDGWTLVHHKPYRMGWARKDGEWRHGKWHTAKRLPVQSDGLYHIPKSVYHGLQH